MSSPGRNRRFYDLVGGPGAPKWLILAAVASPHRHLTGPLRATARVRAKMFFEEEAGKTLQAGARVAYHGRR